MTLVTARPPTVPCVLSVQSHVAFGHVGNAAAVFPLQRLGVEVWPVQTCQLSNHTGYPSFTGQVFTPDHVADVLRGMAERGVLDRLDGVLSGYLGRAEIGQAVVSAVQKARQGGRRVLYLCDPVMGDDLPDGGERLYAAADIPAFMAKVLVPAADVLTPNRFELALLTGLAVTTQDQAVTAARALIALGPRLVVVTSLPGTEADAIACLAVTVDQAWRVETPRIPLEPSPNGAGDALAALLLGHLLRGAAAPDALARAVSGLHAVILATKASGGRELALIAAQEALASDQAAFPASEIS